jgi:glycosyltransferase involved in cell wall biosynthesis
VNDTTAAPVAARPRPADALLSVVCPVFREEAGIAEFHRRLTTALDAIEPAVRWEVIFVNDGSDDQSGLVLRGLCSLDRRCKMIDLSRNFGHQLAITSGLDHANGDAVVVIDSDLQDPPEVIADMVESWRDGNDVVYGVRKARAGEPRWRLFAIRKFYRFINKLADTPLPVDTGDFRLMDRAVLDVLRSMREESRYIRGLVSWIGYTQTAVYYDRDPRHAGRTNYSPIKLIGLAANGITAFSERPLRLASALGGFVTFAAMLLALWIIIGKLIDPSQSIAGYASLLVVVLFFGGVQLLCLGLMGEYIGRIYRESKNRPLYVVRDRVNMDAEERE